MSPFTMVVARRPISSNKGLNPRYSEALRQEALSRQSTIVKGPAYARILWFHKDPTAQDVDNIVKRILDSLKGVVFTDDGVISHCLAARIDATVDYELSGSLPSDSVGQRLLELLDDHLSRDVLYVEIGRRTGTAVHFGEVL